MKFLQKTFLTGLFSLFLFGNATTQAQSFADVSSDHPYYEAIEYAKNNNIVKGYNNGLFSPFKTINRAEFTKIIIGSLYSEEEISSCDTEKFSFPDVKNSDWFAKYVCVAKKEKIINGYADGTFKASNTITLPEAMKIILEGNEIGVDKYEGQEWQEPYMEWAHNEGITQKIQNNRGLNIGTYKITRGEMAYIIMKIKNFTYNIFGEGKYSTFVKGYLSQQSETIMGNERISAYLVITEFKDVYFEDLL